MSIIIQIIDTIFALTIVVCFMFWVTARVMGMSFWKLYNNIFDAVFGETEKFEPNLNTQNPLYERIGSKQPAKFRDAELSSHKKGEFKRKVNYYIKKLKGGLKNEPR